MVDASSLWGILTILGPIVLAVALLWAILHNRTSKRQDARTEAATRELYDKEDSDAPASDRRPH